MLSLGGNGKCPESFTKTELSAGGRPNTRKQASNEPLNEALTIYNNADRVRKDRVSRCLEDMVKWSVANF